jgi:hypothetical protein
MTKEELVNSAFVPEGWSAFRTKAPGGQPALRFIQLEGDRERDWVMVVAGKNDDGTYTPEEILLERGAVGCLEHQIQYCSEEDRPGIEDRLAYAQAIEQAGRTVRGSARANRGKGQ